MRSPLGAPLRSPVLPVRRPERMCGPPSDTQPTCVGERVGECVGERVERVCCLARQGGSARAPTGAHGCVHATLHIAVQEFTHRLNSTADSRQPAATIAPGTATT